MEKIEVGYNAIGTTGNLAHHKFILYTRADGSTFQIHGGGSRDYGYSPVEELVSSGVPGLVGFGHLSAKVFKSSAKQQENALLAPREVIFEGEDLSRTFFKMAGMAQGIAEQESKYHADSNNSNTLVDRIVQWSGGRAPDLDEKHWSPGSLDDQEFDPEFFSKLPPILWGKDTYSKHKDVVGQLFKNTEEDAGEEVLQIEGALDPLDTAQGETDGDQAVMKEAGRIDWGATEEPIRQRHANEPALTAGIIAELASAKSLGSAWEQDFATRYEDYLVFEPALESSASGLAPDVPSLPDRTDISGSFPSANELEPGSLIATGSGQERQSSYDTYRQLGATPEEEAAAVDEYKALLKKSYVDVGGRSRAAEALATWRFEQSWGLSAFVPEGQGTVVKHPVEKMYPDPEKDGHGYVRKDAEAALEARGIRAARWYLSPNEKSGSDKSKGMTDDQGLGPRMTLSYDDESGVRHTVTDSFQADVRSAVKGRREARGRMHRAEAGHAGPELPNAAADVAPAPVPAP
ncbi:hypothetical protein [uncultured Roseibium sp.]|uniref:hypothetical protein n=1 Tax=uncultured Roseibium sp. TaxID=1936171 RepID=UPI00260CCFBD|nr:hypothetical protein [uncultured Roseibium sp.]